MQSPVGLTSSHVYEVTAKDIRRYADAVGDQNPLYFDAEYAATTLHAGIIAPPLFCQALSFRDASTSSLRPDGLPIELDVVSGFDRVVGGASSWELQEVPIRPGDVITVTSKVLASERKAGRTGAFVVLTLESTYVNQHGLLVARERAGFVYR